MGFRALLHGLHGEDHAHQLGLGLASCEDRHEVWCVLGMSRTRKAQGSGKCKKRLFHH
jgi:hypothetical protein